ncbi:MAG: DUF1857 family protein [Gammaproteobacteria bacterium]|nr:DUF1857 family protein [Gammaproteobacteria bacterium]
MLEFEHVIQVNDLTEEDLHILTRTQLWEGLLLRARRPDTFNSSLKVTNKEYGEDEFERIIETGENTFHERVILYPGERIHTQTMEEYEQIEAESVTHLEEPEEGYLFVRFCYRREVEDDGSVDVEEYLKTAYVQTDREAIALIRSLAESGVFG